MEDEEREVGTYQQSLAYTCLEHGGLNCQWLGVDIGSGSDKDWGVAEGNLDKQKKLGKEPNQSQTEYITENDLTNYNHNILSNSL